MKQVIVGLVIAILLCASAIAKDPNKNDFPLNFKVVSSYTESGGGCVMLLEPGDGWVYHVANKPTSIRCYIWPKGTILPGRIRKSGFSWTKLVDVMDKDEKGNLKVYTYSLTGTSSQ